MSLQEILDRHAPEAPALLEELEGYLNGRLSEAGSIPKSRFDEVIAQRNSLREHTRGLSDELVALRERLDGIPESQALHEENEKLTRQVLAGLRREWSQYAPLFELEQGHPLHGKVERIRDDFEFPMEDEEWGAEALEHNLRAIRPYLLADYFKSPEPRPVDATKAASPAPVSSPRMTDLFKHFGG
jgi:hypothetical protein